MELRGAGITVFCGSSPGANPVFLDTARQLGAALGTAGATLVYGGASVGLMGAVADAALGAGGKVLGVIPQQLVDRELAHKGLTQLRVVASMHERKTIMSDQAAGYVVLPGGYGTWEECFEVITWKQVGLHKKVVVLLNVANYYAPLLAMVEAAVEQQFMRPAFKNYLLVARDVPEAMALLRAYAEPAEPLAKWT